jgi:hypothetical protein
MTIPSIKLVVFMLVLSTSAVAQAATYQWQDEQGVTHLTDNSDSIPARYLNRTKEFPSAPGQVTRETPAASPAAAPANSSSSATTGATGAKPGQHGTPSGELQSIKQALPAKKQELARLYRKWSVAKGRTPTAKEVEEFEKKRAKGKATFEDNPYINKNPLSTPGIARLAYHKKLEEVNKDEERIRQLEQDFGSGGR